MGVQEYPETLLSALVMRYVSRKSTSKMKMGNSYCQSRQSKELSLKKTNPSTDLICLAAHPLPPPPHLLVTALIDAVINYLTNQHKSL